MRRAIFVFVLCFISAWEIGCARRTPRAVQFPSASHLTRNQRPARDSGASGNIREAIDSLKNKIQESTQPAESAQAGVASQAGDASTPSTGVGTSGALSVETRYPAQSAQPGSAPRGHLLRRTGDALQHLAVGASFWVIALCALAAGWIVALVLRRSNTSV